MMMMMLLSDPILQATMATTTTKTIDDGNDGGDGAYDDKTCNDGFDNDDSN